MFTRLTITALTTALLSAGAVMGTSTSATADSVGTTSKVRCVVCWKFP